MFIHKRQQIHLKKLPSTLHFRFLIKNFGKERKVLFKLITSSCWVISLDFQTVQNMTPNFELIHFIELPLILLNKTEKFKEKDLTRTRCVTFHVN